jgi:hypothetical protein
MWLNSVFVCQFLIANLSLFDIILLVSLSSFLFLFAQKRLEARQYMVIKERQKKSW